MIRIIRALYLDMSLVNRTTVEYLSNNNVSDIDLYNKACQDNYEVVSIASTHKPSKHKPKDDKVEHACLYQIAYYKEDCLVYYDAKYGARYFLKKRALRKHYQLKKLGYCQRQDYASVGSPKMILCNVQRLDPLVQQLKTKVRVHRHIIIVVIDSSAVQTIISPRAVERYDILY